ncbi:6-phosphogluconolactonase [Vagococcus vulneris]|uniref:Glucosamine/galactosamine-6-phosphate isomerase domain-containing protein n=1 Tax=Vagococcus vulneris TaxID=1977869 RepID=A0A430A0T9_9ENTE|nr:6-phosphogluconolactonase [Vagococcus vulneris]RSU00021.1 hypothetical protein CBF37_01590 [Vagococcus vulneris]
MKIEQFKEVNLIGNQVVEDLKKVLETNPTPLVCIAGGDTTIPIMEAIVQASQTGELDTSAMKFISLDEWGSLGRSVKGSCAQTLYDHLYTPSNTPEENIFFFNGENDLKEEAQKGNDFIKHNEGIDYILLGVGMNGHIGFNEPGIKQEEDTIIVDLDDVTKKVMKKYFTEDYPLEQGITLSLNQILKANQIVVMMTGEHKQEVFKKTVNLVEDPMFPVSMLKKQSEKLSLYVDDKAYAK